MNSLIQKYLSARGALNLPIRASEFRRVLEQHTFKADTADISGYAIKFDAERYAQPFYGRITEGKFQLRPVSKGYRQEKENFLFTGAYEPDGLGVRVEYSLSLNPKALVLWLFLIGLFFIQFLFAAVFAMDGLNIFTFYAVATPLGGLAWVGNRFRKMLQPARKQFEQDLEDMMVQPQEVKPVHASSGARFKSILGTLIVMGAVFLLTGIGAGLYMQQPASPDAMEGWFLLLNFGLGGLVLLAVAGLGYRNRTVG